MTKFPDYKIIDLDFDDQTDLDPIYQHTSLFMNPWFEKVFKENFGVEILDGEFAGVCFKYHDVKFVNDIDAVRYQIAFLIDKNNVVTEYNKEVISELAGQILLDMLRNGKEKGKNNDSEV